MALTSLSAAVSSLQVSQRALEVISNNLANANTPGYHRQESQLASRFPSQVDGLSIGRGVNFVDVRQVRSEVLELSVTRQNSTGGRLESQLRLLTRAESRISVEESSPLTRMEGLFNELQQLSTRLDDPALRSVVINEAKALTDEFNSLSDDLQQLQVDVDAEIRDTVRQVNSFSEDISVLNVSIARTENQGFNAADLKDQRDQLINQMANLIDVRVTPGNAGQSTVIADNVVLVISRETIQLGTSLLPEADAAVTIQATGDTIPVSGGRLAGLLDVRNGTLKDLREQLDTLASSLIAEFDALHTEGVGPAGGFERLDSQRAVSDITANLDDVGLAFPPATGSLFFGVTSNTTGERVIYQLPPIDPGALSLTQFAQNITTNVPNVSAAVSAETGKLSILADPGFEFDFTGGLPTEPFVSAGGSPIQIGGNYTGDTNNNYNILFSGTGTVGSAAPGSLIMTVTDNNPPNGIIGTFDVGQGYEVGSALDLGHGVSVTVGAGDVDAADSFDFDLVADPDTSNILRALGLNTFFTGSRARDISISQDILNDPSRLATSRTRESSDSSNLQRLIGVREQRVFSNGEEDFRGFITSMLSGIGIQVQETTQQKATSDTLSERIEEERQSISGVDPNEELVNMIRYQQQFEAAARFISTVNQTFDELLRIV